MSLIKSSQLLTTFPLSVMAMEPIHNKEQYIKARFRSHKIYFSQELLRHLKQTFKQLESLTYLSCHCDKYQNLE